MERTLRLVVIGQNTFDALEPLSFGGLIENCGLGMRGVHARNMHNLVGIVQDTNYPDIALRTV